MQFGNKHAFYKRPRSPLYSSLCYPSKCHLTSSEGKDELQHHFSMSLPKFLEHYHYVVTNSGETHDFVTCFLSQGHDIVICGATVTRDDLEIHFWEVGF